MYRFWFIYIAKSLAWKYLIHVIMTSKFWGGEYKCGYKTCWLFLLLTLTVYGKRWLTHYIISLLWTDCAPPTLCSAKNDKPASSEGNLSLSLGWSSADESSGKKSTGGQDTGNWEQVFFFFLPRTAPAYFSLLNVFFQSNKSNKNNSSAVCRYVDLGWLCSGIWLLARSAHLQACVLLCVWVSGKVTVL